MKKKIKKVLFIVLIAFILLSSILYVSNALYKTKVNGTAKTMVASPKIGIISESNYNESSDAYAQTPTTHIKILDNVKTHSNKFKVVNYDENGEITEVGLRYKLKFSFSDKNAPLDLKLYNVLENGTEQEVALNDKLETIDSFEFKADKQEQQIFRTELKFDLTSGKMEENVDVKADITAIQVLPK